MIDSIKLLCTDIDGTLLNEERWLSDRTISAFAKANLPTILASSRPPQAMRYLQRGLGIEEAPLIAFNGGLILGRNSVILENNTFSNDILRTLLKQHTTRTYNVSIYSHENWFTCEMDSHTEHEIFTTRDTPIIQDAQATLRHLVEKQLGIHKLMCMGAPEELDAIVRFLEPMYGSKIHLYRSKNTYIEITPKYIDKAKALKKILAYEFDFGMEGVLAFGDNHNDEALLRSAGYGVAVANATVNVKAVADFTSDLTNKENAVAHFIDQVISNKMRV